MPTTCARWRWARKKWDTSRDPAHTEGSWDFLLSSDPLHVHGLVSLKMTRSMEPWLPWRSCRDRAPNTDTAHTPCLWRLMMAVQATMVPPFTATQMPVVGRAEINLAYHLVASSFLHLGLWAVVAPLMPPPLLVLRSAGRAEATVAAHLPSEAKTSRPRRAPPPAVPPARATRAPPQAAPPQAPVRARMLHPPQLPQLLQKLTGTRDQPQHHP